MFDLLVLAGGRGSRMGACSPKPLLEITKESCLQRLVRHAGEAGARLTTVVVRREDRLIFERAVKRYPRVLVWGVEPGLAAGNTLVSVLPATRRRPIYISSADTWYAENPFVGEVDDGTVLVSGGRSLIPQALGGWIEADDGTLRINYSKSPSSSNALAWTGLWRCPTTVSLVDVGEGRRVLVEDIITLASTSMSWEVRPSGWFANLNTASDVHALQQALLGQK